MKYHKIHCKYFNITLKLHLILISWNFYTKKRQKWDKTDTLRQKHRLFRTEIYGTPECFISPLEVMEVTFRMSGSGLPGPQKTLPA